MPYILLCTLRFIKEYIPKISPYQCIYSPHYFLLLHMTALYGYITIQTTPYC